MNKEQSIITCPYCGMEYLPSEIFLPNAFFGKPTRIEKTYDGRILHYDGTGMDTKESYICDNCNKMFYINASVKFNTSTNKKLKDIDEPYTTSLKVNRISLFEN